jgi:hypothetical protein
MQRRISNSRDTVCTRRPGLYSGADNRSKCATRRRWDLDKADTRRLAPYSPADNRSKLAGHIHSRTAEAADRIQAGDNNNTGH